MPAIAVYGVLAKTVNIATIIIIISFATLTLPIIGSLPHRSSNTSAVAYAQEIQTPEKIVILPGSKDHIYRTYFDYPFYLTEPGKDIVWSNPDSVVHSLSITDSQGRQITQTRLEPGSLASTKFQSPGMYHVVCTIYPWMQTNVLISQTSSANYNYTAPSSSSNNNLAAKLSWTSYSDDKVYFRLEFLDRTTGQRHEHIDYEYSASGADGRIISSGGVTHSSSGLDFLSFDPKGEKSVTLGINVRAVNWIPVSMDEAKFTTAITPEFPSSSGLATFLVPAALGATVMLFGLAKRFRPKR